MISKAKQKWIRSLEMKKFRDAEGVFVAEGRKSVDDLMAVLEPVFVSDDPVLAVFRKPEVERVALLDVARTELVVALDGVQDPGNVGTIVRLCAWFGVRHLFVGAGCADVYGPKAVQASMGNLAHVQVHECDLEQALQQGSGEESVGDVVPVYGTFLDGTDIYEKRLSAAGVLVFGSEGRGISDAVAAGVTERVLVPCFPKGKAVTDSLNVAMAAAVVLSEFRRRER